MINTEEYLADCRNNAIEFEFERLRDGINTETVTDILDNYKHALPSVVHAALHILLDKVELTDTTPKTDRTTVLQARAWLHGTIDDALWERATFIVDNSEKFEPEWEEHDQ